MSVTQKNILSYNPRDPMRYPENGRTLTNDVVDLFFSIYTNREEMPAIDVEMALAGGAPNAK